MENLHWADIVTIGLYFVLCLGVGFWVSSRLLKKQKLL